MTTPSNENESCRLTDAAALRIVEHQQRLIGDKTLAKTLGRIVLAFHAAGLSLAPEPSTEPAQSSPS